jgi:hypothetical protein
MTFRRSRPNMPYAINCYHMIGGRPIGWGTGSWARRMNCVPRTGCGDRGSGMGFPKGDRAPRHQLTPPQRRVESYGVR